MKPFAAPRRSSERPVTLGATLPRKVSVPLATVSRVLPAPLVSVIGPAIVLSPASFSIAPLPFGLLVKMLMFAGNVTPPALPSRRSVAALPLKP